MIPSINQTIKAYDEVPYISYPITSTNPSTIYPIAQLFGLDMPSHKSLRVLELGCASGNNILSIATKYPQCQCVGVDLSKVQIEEGIQIIKELNVTNLELKHGSILDVDETFGEFDLIITHGVFSWVNETIQKKILEISCRNLSPNGVAFISYNALPGWTNVKVLREMMQYHTAHISDPMEKARQARFLLQFLLKGLGEYNTGGYAQMIDFELKLLESQANWYLLHDHLEELNNPLYFYQFMEKASPANLQYLAETALARMYPGNLLPDTAAYIQAIKDPIRAEQYLDFIYYTRFRSTLLCHKERALRRNLKPEYMMDKYFINNFKFVINTNEYQLGSSALVTFLTGTQINLVTHDPIQIAPIFAVYEQKGKPIHFDELVKKVRDKFAQANVAIDLDEAAFRISLASQLLRFIFSGGFNMFADADDFESLPGEKPTAYRLAINQAKHQDWVTNLRQEKIMITLADKVLLPLLNGSNDIESIIFTMLPKFQKGELSLTEDEKPIGDPEILKDKVAELVKSKILRYAEIALFEKKNWNP